MTTIKPPVHGAAFLALPKELWFLFDCLCGRRFVPGPDAGRGPAI
jgi:hypothetical protein